MMFEFSSIVDGMFGIALVVILIAVVGRTGLRLLGMSEPGGGLGPVSFFAGVAVIGVLYLLLPEMRKSGLIPDFLSLELFAWILIAIPTIGALFVFLVVVYGILLSITDFFLDRFLGSSRGSGQLVKADDEQKTGSE